MWRLLCWVACVCAIAGSAEGATTRRRAPPQALPTAESLLKLWETGAAGEANRALNRVFPDEMHRIAQTALNEARSGQSNREITDQVSQARADLIRKNLWLAKLAPNDDLLTYADAVLGALREEQSQHPEVCAAIGVGAGHMWMTGRAIDRVVAAKITLIEQGRAHPLRRAAMSNGDLAVALKAAAPHGLSASDGGALATGAIDTMPPAEQCRISIAFVSGLRDAPPDSAAQMVIVMLGGNGEAQQPSTSTPQGVVKMLERSPMLGPAIALLEADMPAELDAMAAAAAEKLKAGDVKGYDAAVFGAIRKLLADNAQALVVAPRDKLLAVQKADAHSAEVAELASASCGVDPAQVAGLPIADAYQHANAETLRAVIDAMLAGRRVLAAAGAAGPPVVLAPTQQDRQAFEVELKRQTRKPEAYLALLDDKLDTAPPAVACAAKSQVARAILALPDSAQARFTADMLKENYGGGRAR